MGRWVALLRPVARPLARDAAILGALGALVALFEVAFVGQLARAPALSALLRLDRAAWALAALVLLRTLGAAASFTWHMQAQERLATRLRTHWLGRVLRASPWAPLPLPRAAVADELMGACGALVTLPLQVVGVAVREPIRLVGFLWTLSGAGLPLFGLLIGVAALSGLAARAIDRRLVAAIEAHDARERAATLTVRDGVEHHAAWLGAGALGRLVARAGERLDAATRAGLGASRWMSLAQLVARMAQYVAIVGVTWAATRLMGRTPGSAELASFAVAVAWLRAPLSAVAGLRGAFTQARPAAARLLALAALPSLAPEPARARALPALRAEIAVSDVVFAYPGGARALDGLTLAWPAGSTLGIAGPSGSGKSTLLRLLARLAAPARGVIRFDDVPLGELAETDLRALVGVALQPPELVRGTLGENLTLARPDAAPAAVAAALAALGLDEVVAGLPAGLETPLDGAPLSSGQLGRVALARLLVAAPPVALIDEPTASLDDDAAAAVVAALARFCPGRTVCVVSHDLRVLAICDRVLHLAAGRVDRSAAPRARAFASGRSRD